MNICAGRVVIVTGAGRGIGREHALAAGWRHGPRVDRGARWEPEEVAAAVATLMESAPPPEPVYGSRVSR
ncbi:hypothetical protein [Nonomuraea mesophila]|uniref:hypothetical protein n=1 Tax=Nonomuraea mesophila TaxID=2530382 RepID=UPI00140D2586|nr:hypothetical protein [Nonomuraea mesophila]